MLKINYFFMILIRPVTFFIWKKYYIFPLYTTAVQMSRFFGSLRETLEKKSNLIGDFERHKEGMNWALIRNVNAVERCK